MKSNHLRPIGIDIAFLAMGIVFFLLHGYNENEGRIGLSTLLQLGGKYLLITFGVYFFSFLIMPGREARFQFSFLLLATYFLFGAVKDALNASTGLQFLSRYRYLIPVLLLLWCGCGFLLYRKRERLHGSIQYVRTLLIVITLMELGIFFYHSFFRREDRYVSDLFADKERKNVENKANPLPDIYWIVLDMYPSSESLQKYWGYSNRLDAALAARGFWVVQKARSNYNYTPFSLCSLLEMQYLHGLSELSEVTPREQFKAIHELRDNALIRLLTENGYRIENYSLFDFTEYPTQGYRFFGKLEMDLIDHQTLDSRLGSEIGWKLQETTIGRWYGDRDKPGYVQDVQQTDRIYKSLLKRYQNALTSESMENKPVFSALHLMLPHEPYIYDREGNLVYKAYNTDTADFIPQLEYTNQQVIDLLDRILKRKTSRNKWIIVQGDHGFKFNETDARFRTGSNDILYAIYPQREALKNWYSEISGVNSFRFLMKEVLGKDLPLLKDTTFQLKYVQSH